MVRQNWEPEDQVEVRFPKSAMEMPAAVEYVAQQVKFPAAASADNYSHSLRNPLHPHV